MAFAFVILCNSAAYAQSPPPAASTQTQRQSLFETAAPGRASVFLNCDNYLAAQFRVPPGAAPTLFTFRLSADGSVHDTALFFSSGSGDLDKAALACANAEHVAPFAQAGAPIDVNWIGAITWQAPIHGYAPADPSGKSGHCSAVQYPPIAMRLNHEGNAIVSYRIATDGTARNPTIVKSTSFDELDRASLQCVSEFRFYPVTQNGQPIEVQSKYEFRWRLH